MEPHSELGASSVLEDDTSLDKMDLNLLLSMLTLLTFRLLRDSLIERLISTHNAVPFLNTLARSDQNVHRYETEEFMRPEKEHSLPLPEDHLIRGQVWSQDYFPSGWYKTNGSDEEEKNIEHASTVRVRGERVKWLAYRLSSVSTLCSSDAPVSDSV